MDKRYKHVYMEHGYTNYIIKFIYSSLNINYKIKLYKSCNITKYKGMLPIT
jgi:hypothetical protein